jgi:hypothetical protein
MDTLRQQNIRVPISDKELERRRTAVLAEMKKQDIDCLIVQTSSPTMGGYVRWFIDIPVSGGSMTVLFFKNGDITTISHGGYPLPPGPPDWAAPGVTNKLNSPYFSTFNYTNTDEPSAAINEMKK